ncbi:hypothetical protein [Elusimicrobium minutum]|uniref:hypothetical protein n=1 Tax=Elusimicrobium minutum TaxID=423605 RepID=UPI0002F7E14E|nr:hypothetical protein [Elusimicrobium minutum]
MYKGILKAGNEEIAIHEVEAIDKGVDTYFKGNADKEIDPAVHKGAEIKLETPEGSHFIIKNCIFEKGGKTFEGKGIEDPR